MTATIHNFPKKIFRVVMRDTTYTTYCFPAPHEGAAEQYAYDLHRGDANISDADYELLVSDIEEMTPICVGVGEVTSQ